MTRDADEALAASGEHLTEALHRVRDKHQRSSQMRRMLKSNHFAESFRLELGGSDDPRG